MRAEIEAEALQNNNCSPSAHKNTQSCSALPLRGTLPAQAKE
jgi:hypothetical protein